MARSSTDSRSSSRDDDVVVVVGLRCVVAATLSMNLSQLVQLDDNPTIPMDFHDFGYHQHL